MNDEDQLLGSLWFGVAALCRSYGVTDPDDMNRIARELLHQPIPDMAGDADAQFKQAAAALGVYDQSMTTPERHLPPFRERCL